MSYAKYRKKVDAGEAFHIDQGAEKLTFTRKSSRKEKFLFVALLIVLAIAVVFIVLYALQVAKTTPTKASLTAACSPAECVLIAAGQFFQHSEIFSLAQLGLICLHKDFHVDLKCSRLYVEFKLPGARLIMFVRSSWSRAVSRKDTDSWSK